LAIVGEKGSKVEGMVVNILPDDSHKETVK
jgi:hypothetical protein